MPEVGLNNSVNTDNKLMVRRNMPIRPYSPVFKATQDVFVNSSVQQPLTGFVPKEESKTNYLDSLNTKFSNAIAGLKSSTKQIVSFCANSSINNAELIVNKRNVALTKQLLKDLDSTNNDTVSLAVALLTKLGTKEAIPKMVDILLKTTTEPELAKEIVKAFGEFKDTQVVQPIIDILMNQNKDEGLRSVAALTLGKLKSRKASKPLFEIVRNEDDSPLVRSHAVIALSDFPTIRNIEQLTRALTDTSELVRANAAMSLSIIGNQESVPDISRLLKDGDPSVKANAALALGNLKAKDAVHELIDALEETNNEVIVSIARALNHIQSPKATKELMDVLSNPNNTLTKRRNSAACLQLIKDQASVNILNNILADKNEDLLLRNYALTALTNMKSSICINNLLNILNDSGENLQLKINAAAGVGILGDITAIDTLLAAAKSSEAPDLKINCVNAVRNIVNRADDKSKIITAKILPFLNDETMEIRALTANTLKLLKPREAISQLLTVANNQKEENVVRAMAIEALGEIGDKRVATDLMLILRSNCEHQLCSRAAAAMYKLGLKKDLFNIIKSQDENYEIKNHAAGVLIAMGEKSVALEEFLQPALNVKRLHNENIKGRGIELAVIDDVVDATHPEFDKRVIIEPLEHHGTMVAGSLGGNISGVAPESIIHSYNAFDKLSVDQILERIIEQKIKGDNDIKVVNISLGYNPKLMAKPDIQAELARFDKMAKIANKLGITVVVAAGNDGTDMPVPVFGTLNLLCLSDNVISVGATKTNGTPDDPSDDSRADFSSYPAAECPRSIDLLAPGSEVTLPFIGGSYKTVDGTSFSAPYVAGLVALMYEVNPDITPEKVKEILKSTANKLNDTPDNMQGAGQVNPIKAVISAMSLVDFDSAQKLTQKLGENFQTQLQFPEVGSKFKKTA